MAKFFFIEPSVKGLIIKDEKVGGGAAVQTLVWMNALREQGHQIFLADFEDDERELKPEYQHLNLIKTYNTKKGLRWLRWSYYRFPKVYAALKTCQPDYFYESIPFWGSYVYSFLCKTLGIKHVIRISNDNLLDERLQYTASKAHQRFLFWGLKTCDVILSQNDYQYRTLTKRFPNKRILKIHNPILIDRKSLVPKEKSEGGYFAWVANFRYQKNLHLLYEIAVILPQETFKVAGTPNRNIDGESLMFLEKLKKLPNVEFTGAVARNDLLSFLKEAKYLLNTSRYEGFSNTFLEAMVVGTPILTTPAVNPDSIISNNQLGIVYENPEDLVQKISSTTSEGYFNLSSNCTEFVFANHDHLTLATRLTTYLNAPGIEQAEVIGSPKTNNI
jgi:glycosyltransferase involved in cell wall biosynthesis